MVQTLGYYNWNAPPAAPPPPPPPPPPGTTYTVPNTIDTTGATDVTTLMQNFLSSVPSGADNADRNTILFPSGATYRCEGTVYLIQQSNLFVEGSGSMIFASTDTASRTRAHFSIGTGADIPDEGCHNITIHDLYIKGSNPATSFANNVYNSALEAQNGITIQASNAYNILVDTCNVTNTRGDGVYFGLGGHTTTFPFNCRVTNTTVALPGRMDMSVAAGNHIELDHNTVSGSPRHFFDLEPDVNYQTVDSINIHDNTCTNAGLGFVAGSGAGIVTNVTINNNTIHGVGMIIPAAASFYNGAYAARDGWVITNNTTDTPWASSVAVALMAFRNANGITVTGNTAPLEAGRGNYLVSLEACTGTINISGNTIVNAAGEFLIRPTILSLSPDHGSGFGGTSVTFIGVNLTGVTSLTFNGIAPTSFTVVNDTTITCVSPADTTQAGNTTLVIPADKSGVPQKTAQLKVNARASTIVVKNTAGTVTYILNTDYTLTLITNPNAVNEYNYVLTRKTTGAIVAGQSVVCTYQWYGDANNAPIAIADTYGEGAAGDIWTYVAVD